MEPILLAKVTRVRDAANAAIAAHMKRREEHFGLTPNERTGLHILAEEIAALRREDAFPLSETAA